MLKHTTPESKGLVSIILRVFALHFLRRSHSPACVCQQANRGEPLASNHWVVDTGGRREVAKHEGSVQVARGD